MLVTTSAQDRPRLQPGLLLLLLDLLRVAGTLTGKSMSTSTLPELVAEGVDASWRQDLQSRNLADTRQGESA
jgi:hypothetical protein